MNKEIVSVITPSLNSGQFIERCISSVKKQHQYIMEHIIVDGGSTDETLIIVEKSKYQKLKLITGKDKGQSDAINKGVRISSGDIVCWLNADDYLYNDALMDLESELFDNTWDILYGDMTIVDANKKIVFVPSIPARWLYLLRMGCYIPSTGCFFRKRTACNKGYFLRTDLNYVMDWEIFLRLYSRGLRFKNVNTLVSCFRMHQGNRTSNVIERRKERIKIQREFGLWIPDNYFGKTNMWTQYYLTRVIYKLELLIRRRIPGLS